VLLLLIGLGAYGVNYWLRSGGGGFLATTKPAATQPSRAIPVGAAPARRGDLPIYLTGLGTVTAYYNVIVHTRVDGQLEKVFFKEGQFVHEGDPLVEIDPRPFEVQLKQAQGQLIRDQASLKNARLDVVRYQEAGQAASQQQRDTAAAAVGQFEGAVLTDQGQIDSANLQLIYCHIASPVTGNVGLRIVDPGNIVHAADPNGLVVVAQIEPIAVLFPLPQDYLPQVFKAMDSGKTLVVEAYDRNLKTRLATGTLYAVDNQVNVSTGTVIFKAVFENKDHSLFPNQFVNARLLVSTKKNVILIPAAAVQQSPQGMFVYVVKADDTVEMRPITLGPSGGEVNSVDKGLSPGELVVTDGVDKLQSGTAVRPNKAGATTKPEGTTRPAGTTRPGASTRPHARADLGMAPDTAPASHPAESGGPEAPARHGTQ
jgi:multidrug efflux system membrane fusion protein